VLWAWQLREAPGGGDSAGLLRARAKLAARASEEEGLFTRVPLSRTERQGLKAARRAGLAGGALLDDFADDVADLVQVGNRLNVPSALNNMASPRPQAAPD